VPGAEDGNSRADRLTRFQPGTGHRAPGTKSAATVTFLLTDIEGSTRLWLEHPDAMRCALDRHDALAAAVIAQHDGMLVKQGGEGDSLFTVFARASDAVAAAVDLQRELSVESWPAETPLQVRMALHTGEAELREGDYYGPVVNHCARLRAVGHGGQILLSQTTAALVSDDRSRLPAGVSLRELGVHRLKDLQRPEPILQLAHPDLPAEFPPLRSLEAFAHNLPVQLTRFIGRERELTEAKRLLASTHLLTLTGAGGCGKTRLALQVAAELLDAPDPGADMPCPDGAWLVELAALSDPTLVPQTVASVFGVREEPHRSLTATLADALRPRTLLLVLDNCEHLLPACAGLAETLLQHCPRLRILATSREGLRIAGETTYRVPSLSMPDRDRSPSPAVLTRCEAAQLFVDRAIAAVPSFTLSDQNAVAVAQVCHRLDGIPLAIELAAARVKVLPVEKVAERLGDRFRLLTGGSRTALPRQQTLRALIEWSHDLLSEPEQICLRRLSVFAGRWSLEAAEAVCADSRPTNDQRPTTNEEDGPRPVGRRSLVVGRDEVLDLLTSLVEKSLVVYEEGEGEAQYRLLETIRQYARDRLMETEGEAGARGRHCDWFLALAEQAAPELRGPRQIDWLDRLESEHDNLRLALEWCRTEPTGAEAELRLAGALAWFWTMRCYLSEGRHHLEAALCRGSETPASFRVRALLGAGELAAFSGDFAGSGSFYQACLDLARATGDLEGMARALSGLAMQAFQDNDRDRANALAEEGLTRAREAGDPWLIGFCMHIVGVVVRMSEDLEQAATLLQDSLVLMHQVGDRWGTMFVVLGMGGVAQARGDYEPARRAYQEALALNQQLKDRRGMAWCLQCLAEVAAAQGRSQRGARLMGAAVEQLDAIGGSWPRTYVASRERALATIRTALGEEATAAACGEGRAMALEEAVAYALEENDPSPGDEAKPS
jgi:predicted ATPase/class 3 adenylate cyclase